MNTIWIKTETVKDKLTALAYLSILTKKPISSSAPRSINDKNLTIVGIDQDGKANLFYSSDSVKTFTIDECLGFRTLEELNNHFNPPQPQLKLGSKFSALNIITNKSSEFTIIRVNGWYRLLTNAFETVPVTFENLTQLNAFYANNSAFKILN